MSKNRATPLSAAVALALAASCSLAGAQTMTQRERGTAIGAGVGAAAGAAVGAATGGKAVPGAVIGGALGAVAGNLWSKHMEDKRAEMERATHGTGIEVARTADNQLKVEVPSDFSFGPGSAQINPQMRPVLDQLAQGLDPKTRVTIVGYSDATGSEATNDRLSLDRAINVRDYLRNLGVDPNRMIVNGRGECEPIASNDTAAGRMQNRRVEILLSEPTVRG